MLSLSGYCYSVYRTLLNNDYECYFVCCFVEVMKNTAASVMTAPINCIGVKVSFSTRNPVIVAKTGVKKVRLDSAVRFPLLAL